MKSAHVLMGLLTGLIGAQFAVFPIWTWALIFFLALSLGLYEQRKSRDLILSNRHKLISRILLFSTCVAFGGLRVSLTQQSNEKANISAASVETMTDFTGVMAAPPKKTSKRVYLRLKNCADTYSGKRIGTGNIQLVFYQSPNEVFQYGDEVKIKGKIIPIDETAKSLYFHSLIRQGISAVVYNPEIQNTQINNSSRFLAKIFSIRANLLKRIYSCFPSPEAGLTAGILLGDESEIPNFVQREFQLTGTAHVIAISGANFAMIVWFLLGVLHRFFHRWWSSLLMIPLIAIYALMVGGNPAVTRAAIMCGISMLCVSLGRRSYGPEMLLLTAGTMVFYNPLIIADIGFQLSVMATLGIFLFSEPLKYLSHLILAKFIKNPNKKRETLQNIIDDWLIVSISAQILTIWISAAKFNHLSWVSLLANFLIAPLQPIIMTGGFLFLILALTLPEMAPIAAKILFPAPALTIRIVHWMAAIPGASQYVELSESSAWLIIATIVIFWMMRKKVLKTIKLKSASSIISIAMIIGGMSALGLWVSGLEMLDHRLHLSTEWTSNQKSLKITSARKTGALIAIGQSAYSASDLLSKGLLGPKSPEIVMLGFSEPWMAKKIDRSISEKTTLLCLDAQCVNKSDLEEETTFQKQPGLTFHFDDTKIVLQSVFLGREAWSLDYENLHMLIPFGIPAERIISVGFPISADLFVVLSQADNLSEWQRLVGENQIIDGMKRNLDLYSDGKKLWIYGK